MKKNYNIMVETTMLGQELYISSWKINDYLEIFKNIPLQFRVKIIYDIKTAHDSI